MNQPTLASIPGILLRTILRLIARMLLTVAGVVLLVGTALALCSLLLATWRTPRSRRVELAANIVLLLADIAKDYRRLSKTD